jgi:hypothetical protein
MDVSFYVGEHPEENVKCDLPVYKFPKVIEGDGIVQVTVPNRVLQSVSRI